MSELLKINVNDKTEKKGNLTYLSWAWAWAEVLKVDPLATWDAVEYKNPDGSISPCMWIGDTAMVKTVVTVSGNAKTCQLAVMDNKNNAVKNPDARKISDAIMRCMTKACSMHGLGLYIYAGEDLPEGQDTPDKPIITGARDGIGEDLPEDWKIYLKDLAQEITELVRTGHTPAALERIGGEKLDDDQRIYLESQMDSKTRSALKKA